MRKSVFCDTNFFIHLLDKNATLHTNAKGYFQYFAKNEFDLLISTIAIAEYCIKGNFNELPLRNLQIVPFNLDHSKRTSEFAKIAFEAKNTSKLNLSQRTLIPNDTKLFAQADCEKSVDIYLSSDTESQTIYNLLKEHPKLTITPKFKFINLNTPHYETFGILDLK